MEEGAAGGLYAVAGLEVHLSQVTRRIDTVEPVDSVVTIGVFDGVHRGHRRLVEKVQEHAEREGLRCVAITFDRHPMEVVRPGSQPKYLQPLDRKIDALLETGVDLVHVIPFDQARSQQTAEAFIAETLAGPLQAQHVVIGENFRFGHRAAGDVDLLTARGKDLGFTVDAVSLVGVEDTVISSSEIRARIANGEVEWAAAALGRPHVVEGVVARGEARGATIGFPTANVEVDDRMQLPAHGVYAGHAEVVDRDDTRHQAVVNIGTRPTFGGGHVTIEAHLLDVDLDLYGEHLAVHLEHRLRDEQRFNGIDELTAQITADVDRARDLLSG